MVDASHTGVSQIGVGVVIAVFQVIIHSFLAFVCNIVKSVVYFAFVNSFFDFYLGNGNLLEGVVGSQGVFCQGLTLFGVIAGDIL